MNPSSPPQRSQAMSGILSLSRRIKRGRLNSFRLLPILAVVGVVILSLPMTGVRSASKEEDESLRSPQRHDGHPVPASTNSAAVPVYRNTAGDVMYVGSVACKSCHEQEFQHYFQTPHGQAAMLPVDRPELRGLPPQGVTVCPDDGGHCFRVFHGKDGYFMSQFDREAGGTETNVEVEKVAFAMGKPLMAVGYVIQRGDYLFEAPLTFFAVPGLEPGQEHAQGWALSPGYTNHSRAFNRPLIDACLSCHVGRPRAMETGINLYKSPPFEELAIGCESCHGPGALHVRERQQHRGQLSAHAGPDTSIVNPKYLPSQLADDTCMYCHELGEARVTQPGRSLQDYRPGVPLLRTVAIFKSKLLLGWNLEEWSDEMATSVCYRSSNGAMRCSTCHDPHSTPSAQDSAEFYRSKCLSCHQSASCTLPIAQRQQTQPVDNCITCHMPKHTAPRLIKFGGRGTSHRITKTDDEPLPPAYGSRTAANSKTGLILTDSDSADAQTHVDPVVLLKAYQDIQVRNHTNEPGRHDDLAAQYDALLLRLSSDPKDAAVFSALANSEAAKHTEEGNRRAIHDLQEAIRLDSDTPKDYMLLSELQFHARDFNGAIAVLTIALKRFPYTPAVYEHLAACYSSIGQRFKASEAIQSGLRLFPADKNLLALSQQL